MYFYVYLCINIYIMFCRGSTMNKNNPYTLSFGSIPHQLIGRDIIISDLLEALNNEYSGEQAFKLTGVRGAGKTVTLTIIEKELKNDNSWITVDLKSSGNVTEELISNLYSQEGFLTKYIDANLNLSAFGVGLNLSAKSPTTSTDVALKQLLSEVKRKKKKVLVVIDELRKTDYIVSFIQEFQILIRAELPIYLIVAGLYEDIEAVENTDGLTFFLRAESFEMEPLGINVIREDYKQTLGLPTDKADALAKMTKGYAFAYQAFGKYMWDSHDAEITDLILAKVDDALAKRVYNKLWSELSAKEKNYLSFIAQKDSMQVEELLALTKEKHSDWSRPRKRLIEKGIIGSSGRGEIHLCLPRFGNYINENVTI